MYPAKLKYVESHQWIKLENDIGTIGITKYGQEKMGDIVYVELPPKGKELKKGESLCTMESVKAALDIASPVSGKIIEINEKLNEDPSLVNKDSYGEGWLVKMKISDPSELDSLLTHIEYEKLLGKEAS